MESGMSESGNDLASRHCVPCRGGTPPLKDEDLAKISAELPDWSVVDQHHIEKTFKFPNFKSALAFVNRIGEIAEQQGHHPDICFGWGSVKVTNFTHKIKGLTESDFILGAKIDQLYFPGRE
jgi:4a-hydroxytetrahydrobiopterin dehydratase